VVWQFCAKSYGNSATLYDNACQCYSPNSGRKWSCYKNRVRQSTGLNDASLSTDSAFLSSENLLAFLELIFTLSSAVDPNIKWNHLCSALPSLKTLFWYLRVKTMYVYRCVFWKAYPSLSTAIGGQTERGRMYATDYGAHVCILFQSSRSLGFSVSISLSDDCLQLLLLNLSWSGCCFSRAV